MSGMREYLMGSPSGKKGWYETGKPRNRKKGATRYLGAHTTATEHTNHRLEGTKSASGTPTRASKHKQGMERSEPAAANDTRKEEPRTD